MDTQHEYLIDAIGCISNAMRDPNYWNRKKKAQLKQAIGLLMQVTDQLDNIEIGPEPASTWKTMTVLEGDKDE